MKNSAVFLVVVLLTAQTSLTRGASSIIPVQASSSSSNAQQTSSDVAGKYEGAAEGGEQGRIPVTAQIKNDSGKISGTIDIPQGTLPITGGTYSADGKLTMNFKAGDNAGTITAEYKNGRIIGTWKTTDDSGTLELKKADATGAAMKDGTKSASGGDHQQQQMSGVWNGVATLADGGTIPFTLTLKVENGKVAGESRSERGTSTVTKGNVAGDKLNFTLEGAGGTVVMTAMLKDAKLSGDFDYAGGQAQGKWEATRKD